MAKLGPLPPVPPPRTPPLPEPPPQPRPTPAEKTRRALDQMDRRRPRRSRSRPPATKIRVGSGSTSELTSLLKRTSARSFRPLPLRNAPYVPSESPIRPESQPPVKVEG